MEKLTLKPRTQEIVVNNGAADGAVDLFSYTPDETAARTLGSLYVIGHRDDDSSNMGYIVSLIAALARREYYAQPSTPPREAFARTLRKANEVVEEFFKAGDVKLSVGIVAVSGGQIMVSKLDKFKILLARENQVIDILSNVLLFSKEHTERRRFSSIIHGTVQAGDRILAFVPTKVVTTRERNLKGLFLSLPQHEFAERVSQIGQEHAAFATAMLHIDIAQSSEPALMPSPQPPEMTPQPVLPESAITPTLAANQRLEANVPPIAWSPRQQSAPPVSVAQTAQASDIRGIPQYTAASSEVPHLIPSEFSLGTRRTVLSRLLGRMRFVRLDGRGKAISLALAVVLISGGVLAAKSLLIVSPQQQQERQALADIEQDVSLARSKATDGADVEARHILTRAMTSLEALGLTDDTSRALSASIVTALDEVDRAQSVEPTLLASPAPGTDVITLATWASPSQSLRVGGARSGGVWIATLTDGAISGTAQLTDAKADLLIGWKGSAVAFDTVSRTLWRIVGGDVKSYVIPIQEAVLDVAEFSDSLYVLTDRSILKISDLDTDKPVTKRWLTKDDDLVAGAARIFVDGSVYTMGRDGTLTTYYKGAKVSQVQAPLSPSGIWRLLPSADSLLAVAAGDARRIYLIDPASGKLVRTLKIDSLLPFTLVAPGPDYSVLLLTSEGKLWQVK